MQLRNPDFGNSYTIAPNVDVRLSMDGDIRKATFNAITVTRQKLTFSGLTLDQKNALQSFMLGNAGIQFVWNTHLGVPVTVIIVDNTVTFTRLGSGCLYQFSITVEEV